MPKPFTYLEVLQILNTPDEWYPDAESNYPKRCYEFVIAQQAKIEALEAQLVKPQIAAKIGGSAFVIPPHDQAPTLSAEVQAVNEILEGEDNGES